MQTACMYEVTKQGLLNFAKKVFILTKRVKEIKKIIEISKKNGFARFVKQNICTMYICSVVNLAT